MKKKKLEEKLSKRNNEGITLIALVIIIVVLLILAGVTIAMLTGQSGILTQAQEAKEKNKKAEGKEKLQLIVAESLDSNSLTYDLEKIKNNLKNEENIETEKFGETLLKVKIDNTYYSVSNDGLVTKLIKPGEVVNKTEKNNYIDDEGNSATIPKGFTVSGNLNEQKVSRGLVIYNMENNEGTNLTENSNFEDIPIDQTKYDQYVWIPTNKIELSRRTFTNNGSTLVEGANTIEYNYCGEEDQRSILNASNQNEKIYNIETFKMSCEKYGGYYVGRYEAGNENNSVVSKRNATIYNNISPSKALEISKENNDEYIKSLINSYAWDTMLEYICQNNGYELANTVDSNHGNINTKEIYNSGMYKVNSVYVDNYNNIYDVIGNVREWTTEYSTNSRGIYVNRGGYFDNNVFTAGSRRPYNDNAIYPSFGFRQVLYIK